MKKVLDTYSSKNDINIKHLKLKSIRMVLKRTIQ